MEVLNLDYIREAYKVAAVNIGAKVAVIAIKPSLIF